MGKIIYSSIWDKLLRGKRFFGVRSVKRAYTGFSRIPYNEFTEQMTGDMADEIRREPLTNGKEVDDKKRNSDK